MDWLKLVLDVVLSAAVLALVPKLFVWLTAIVNRNKLLAKTELDDIALHWMQIVVENVTAPLAAQYREATEDGKLTELEKANLHAQAKEAVVAVLKSRGIDALKEIGSEALDLFIKLVVEKLKRNTAS